jgi:[ribosomal protein S5]-alanine N-acetyltransferase
MTFEFGQFALRKPQPEDANGFIEICSDAEAMKYYGIPGATIRTVEDAKSQIDWCNDLFRRNSGRWIIVERTKDKYIGDIGFHNYVELHSRVEIGYRLFRTYWGRGIITSFIGQLLQCGFGQNGYNRVEAMVDSRNVGSKKVLLKNRFQLEGTMREYESDHGHFVDLEMYSVLRRDFLR